MNIFQTGEFTLHSGSLSNFKIECDALTDKDLDTIALLISQKFDFKTVIGVPYGGTRLATKLRIYADPNSDNNLVVDDILTTGASMEEYRVTNDEENIGIVIFARGPCPEWVMPIFQMWDN